MLVMITASCRIGGLFRCGEEIGNVFEPLTRRVANTIGNFHLGKFRQQIADVATASSS